MSILESLSWTHAIIGVICFLMGIIVGKHLEVKVDVHLEPPNEGAHVKKSWLSREPVIIPRIPLVSVMAVFTVIFILCAAGAIRATMRATEAEERATEARMATESEKLCAIKTTDDAIKLWADLYDQFTTDPEEQGSQEERRATFLKSIETYRDSLIDLQKARRSKSAAEACAAKE